MILDLTRNVYRSTPMNDFESFLDLPIAAQVAAICFVACAAGLLLVVLTAPRRDCFFLRWPPEIRFLALLASPALLIVWPIELFGLFLRSRGLEWDDLDFDD
jgi:hypothetical protein